MIDKYSVFLKVIESDSLSKAAEELGYTQSGISHIIKRIEQELHISLILRDRSGIKLTPEGEAILPYIQEVCNTYRNLYDKVNELQGIDSGIIRIGLFSSISCHVLPDFINKFKMSHPMVEFELLFGDYSQIEDWVEDGSIDYGFISSFKERRNKEKIIPFIQDRLLVLLPETHTYARAEVFPIKQIEEEPFILLDEGYDNEINYLFESLKIKPKIIFKIKDDYSIMAMVEKGLGISILPELVLNRNPYKVITKELSIPCSRQIDIIHKRNRLLSAAADKFLKVILNK